MQHSTAQPVPGWKPAAFMYPCRACGTSGCIIAIQHGVHPLEKEGVREGNLAAVLPESNRRDSRGLRRESDRQVSEHCFIRPSVLVLARRLIMRNYHGLYRIHSLVGPSIRKDSGARGAYLEEYKVLCLRCILRRLDLVLIHPSFRDLPQYTII